MIDTGRLIVEALTLGLALLLGVKALLEFRESTAQRQVDLRWRKAEMSKTLIDECWRDPYANAALTMLDWDNRVFVVAGKSTGVISRPMMIHSLRIAERNAFSNDELFVRDAFDALFNHMTRMEHFTNIELVERSDLSAWWSYYVKCMHRHEAVMLRFLNNYEYPLAVAFYRSFGVIQIERSALP